MKKTVLTTLIVVLLLIAGGTVWYFMYPHVFTTQKCATMITSDAGIQYVDVDDPQLIRIEDKSTSTYFLKRYFKDNCHVYIGTGGVDADVVEQADPKTFKLLAVEAVKKTTDCNGPECTIRVSVGKDARNVYSDGTIVSGIDAASFAMLSTPDGKVSVYGKDKTHVYAFIQYSIVTVDADLNTFTVTDPVQAKDKNHTYLEGVTK